MTADKWADVAAEKWEHQSNVPLDDAIEYIIEEVVTSAVAEERVGLEDRMRDAIKEITAGMALRKDPEWDKGDNWNNASLRAIEIIKENLKGEGLFQSLAAAIRKEVKP